MIQDSRMTRWTSPTNAQFYALHKEAIEFYTTIAAIAQGFWLIFSVKPLAKLLTSSLDWLPENYGYVAAVAVLAYLHWQLHKLLKYIAFNLLDNDPNTNSSVVHYALAAVITLGMLALDIQGTTAFFRDGDKFDGLVTANDGKKSGEQAQRQARYDQDIATLAKSEKAEISAVERAYTPSINAVKNRRTFDQWDIAKRKKDANVLEAKRDAEIAAIETAYANQAKTLLAAKNSDLAEIGNQHTNRHQRITTADDQNAAKSNRYGWMISCICLIVLLGCTYQVTDLRVRSGQKPIARITIADETGSFGSKLHDALTDIGQRWGHLAVFNIHNALAVKELDELDGSYHIKGRTQSAASTPPPTTPPLSNNNPNPNPNPPSGGGGNGGGGNNPPQQPTAPPTGGNVQAAPVVTQSDIAVAENMPTAPSMRAAVKDFGYNTISEVPTAKAVEVLKLAREYDKPRPTRFLDLPIDGQKKAINELSDLGAALEIGQAATRLRAVNPLINGNFEVADKAAFNTEWLAIWEAEMRKSAAAAPSVIDVYTSPVEPDTDDENPKDVYTTYIRGYIETEGETWRNPTAFITLLRNAYNRGYEKKVELRREQLAAHLDDKHITAEIVSFCRKNRDIVGETVWAKFQRVLGEEVNNG